MEIFGGIPLGELVDMAIWLVGVGTVISKSVRFVAKGIDKK